MEPVQVVEGAIPLLHAMAWHHNRMYHWHWLDGDAISHNLRLDPNGKARPFMDTNPHRMFLLLLLVAISNGMEQDIMDEGRFLSNSGRTNEWIYITGFLAWMDGWIDGWHTSWWAGPPEHGWCKTNAGAGKNYGITTLSPKLRNRSCFMFHVYRNMFY